MTLAKLKRYSSPDFIRDAVRKKGLGHVIHMGTAFALRQLIPQSIRQQFWKAIDAVFPHHTARGRLLYAFYDLSVSPPSYDFATFLYLAEIDRAERRAANIRVVIVPGPNNGFRSQSKEKNRLGVGNLQWRLQNIVIPLTSLLPSCQGITQLTSRDEGYALLKAAKGSVFPRTYTLRMPNKYDSAKYIKLAKHRGAAMPTLRAPIAARHYVSEWMRQRAHGRRVISITLRESTDGVERNSNLVEWAKFADSLDKKLYEPVFVRDTETALGPVPTELQGQALFYEGPWNVALRAAFYELSYLNLFVNNGPAIIALYNQAAPYLYFKVVTSAYPSTTAEFLRDHIGISVGGNFPMATSLQKLVWEDDSYEVIRREFEAMVDTIEHQA